MSDTNFTRDWLRNARKWLAWLTATAVISAMMFTLSYTLAWVGRTYGGATLLVVVVILCALLIVGGSAVQTRMERTYPTKDR